MKGQTRRCLYEVMLEQNLPLLILPDGGVYGANDIQPSPTPGVFGMLLRVGMLDANFSDCFLNFLISASRFFCAAVISFSFCFAASNAV
jgi:hypothetical protein